MRGLEQFRMNKKKPTVKVPFILPTYIASTRMRVIVTGHRVMLTGTIYRKLCQLHHHTSHTRTTQLVFFTHTYESSNSIMRLICLTYTHHTRCATRSIAMHTWLECRCMNNITHRDSDAASRARPHTITHSTQHTHVAEQSLLLSPLTHVIRSRQPPGQPSKERDSRPIHTIHTTDTFYCGVSGLLSALVACSLSHIPTHRHITHTYMALSPFVCIRAVANMATMVYSSGQQLRSISAECWVCDVTRSHKNYQVSRTNCVALQSSKQQVSSSSSSSKDKHKLLKSVINAKLSVCAVLCSSPNFDSPHHTKITIHFRTKKKRPNFSRRSRATKVKQQQLSIDKRRQWTKQAPPA